MGCRDIQLPTLQISKQMNEKNYGKIFLIKRVYTICYNRKQIKSDEHK